MALRCVPFPNSISGVVSGGNTLLSILTLVKFELVAMMVLASFFAATNLERGLAPLEHGLLCGLVHVGLVPRQCAATLVLKYVASVGVEMVSGTPCLRGCYGGGGRDLGYPHGVRVGSCCGDSLCGSHAHRLCLWLPFFVL